MGEASLMENNPAKNEKKRKDQDPLKEGLDEMGDDDLESIAGGEGMDTGKIIP